jgi:Tfp pilus assembly protein PilO
MSPLKSSANFFKTLPGRLSLKQREKTLALAALFLAAGLIVFSKMVLPLKNTLKRQSAEIEKKKIMVQKNEALIKEAGSLNEKLSFLSKNIQAKLPLDRKESEFLSEIGNVAQNTDVHIERMNPRPARDLGSFKELSVDIDMEANLGNLIRFLYRMRESSVVLAANSLKLQPKAERSALLKGHLVISTIFLKAQ